MKKTFIIFFFLFIAGSNLLAQFKLKVEGNAEIQGNLFLGVTEADIYGLDRLIGVNDLRFSADEGFTEHMRLTNIGYLGIGTTDPDYKLHVLGETQTALGLTNTSTGGRAWALYSLGTGNIEGAGSFMIRDETSGNNRFFIDLNGNIGIGTITPGNARLLSTAGVNSNYAILGRNNNTSGEQIGLYGELSSSGDGTRIGAYGRILGNGGTGQHYGVYGLVDETNTTNITVGVFGSNTSTGTGTYYAGYFSGNVTVTGIFDNPSDEKLKKNISGLEKATEQIMALRPVSYEFRGRDFPQMQLAEGKQMGFIAQEVEAVFPELVKKNKHPESPKAWDENGETTEYYPAVDYKGLNYNGLIPVLTRAIQEQQEEIAQLETKVTARDRRITDLEDRLAKLELLVDKLIQPEEDGAVIPISDGALLQNQPNPFTETTRIAFNVPASVQKAELIITDASGRVLKTIRIDQRGVGQTTLGARSLSAGTYFYSLVWDGAVQDTKKMVLTRR